MTNRRLVQKLSRRAPSPAMVVACLALIVALGGTSYAAIRLPANSVGTKQLKKGAVTGVKVRSNALGGAQINESRLGKVPSAASADIADIAASAASATNADNATAAGRAPVTRLDYRQSAPVSIPISPSWVRASVNCDTGLNAVGGGAKASNPGAAFIIDTNPVGNATWTATASADTTGHTLTVFVICAQAATTTP